MKKLIAFVITVLCLDLTALEQSVIMTYKNNEETSHILNRKSETIKGDSYLSGIVGFSDIIDFKIIDNLYLLNSFDINIEASDNPNVNISELYSQLNYGNLYFYIGKKKESLGSAYGILSSGSIVMSEDASPIWKLSAGFSEYQSIPFTNNILSVKGHIAHGYFDSGRFTDHLLLHEKDIYVKVEPITGFSFSAGLIHEAQWAGSNPSITDFEISLDNYVSVFTAKEGGSDSPEGDQQNKIGNHLGAWDFSLAASVKGIDYRAYYQHYFEDNSGLRDWKNKYDGLWGLNVYNQDKTWEVVAEWLYTVYQSGDEHDSNGTVLGGRDSYYHHWLYNNGWTNNDSILGNMFFLYSGEGEDLRISSNRINAINLGFVYNWSKFKNQINIARAIHHPSYSSISVVEKNTKTQYYVFNSFTYDSSELFNLPSTLSFNAGADIGDISNNLTLQVLFSFMY